MARFAMVISVVGCLLVSQQQVQSQQVNPEVELLKRELALAKKECELAKKENEILRKEIDQHNNPAYKPAGGVAKADKNEKPSATADGIKYVLDNVSRNGTRVTLHFIAINTKADCMILLPKAEAVDTDGNLYTSALPRNLVNRLRLREGLKTRFDIAIPNVPASATEFGRVDIQGITRLGSRGQRLIGSERESVQFKKVRIGE